MKSAVRILLVLLLSPLLPLTSEAQCTSGANSCAQPVPHLVKFSGVLKNTLGVPRTGVVSMRFVIYGDETRGTPLWQEVQNVRLDQQGHYEVMLGATGSEGISMELFTSGEPRWLGVQALLPGEEEQPRVLLVSVPYALEAADAQTLGGLPASAFMKAAPTAAVLGTPGSNAAPAAAAPLTFAGTAAIGETTSGSAAVQAAVTTPGGTANTIPKFSSGASIVNSQITDQNGVVSVENLSNILFAERFPGGVPDAVNACPGNGCIIYATSPNVNLNLGNIDPGFKAITIYLGPYTYTVKQVTLRKALKIIGMGASGGTKSPCSPTTPCNGTALQSINGNNPVFVVPQTNNSPATNVLLTGFRLYGSVGNTNEDGFFLDTSTTYNSGVWYSAIDDVYLEGFAGIAMHIRGRNSDFGSISQWILFNNVVAWRTTGGGNALRLEGSVFELRFRNCEFDGQSAGDGTNIYIGGLAGGISGYPLSIAFEGLVTQQAATAVQIDGATHVTFYGSHHEKVWGVYQVNNSFGIWTQGLTITDSYFAGDVGSNGGLGYLLNVTTTVAQGISFTHNSIFGKPDSVVKGTNLSSIAYQDNLYQAAIYEGSGAGTLNVPPTSGITTQLGPAAIINIQGAHTIGLNPSSTPITTIRSTLGPGEMVTFFTFAGPAIFASGGNINLVNSASVTVNGSITFVRIDLGGSKWIPVAQWPSSSAAQPSLSALSRPRGQSEPVSARDHEFVYRSSPRGQLSF
jgi:hypothetical protein